MNIPDYLEKHSLSQEGFAKKIGVTQGAVWQWLSGRSRITTQRAQQIERVTGGQITCRDLLPALFSRRNGHKRAV